MKRVAKIVALELLLKGGFFVGGVLMYFSDKTVFGRFTLTNALFTLAYNTTCFGMPFLYARMLHMNRNSSVLKLSPLALCSVSLAGAGLILFPSNYLYIVAALLMIVSDTIYSKYRIVQDTGLYRSLLLSGVILFGWNLASGVFLNVDFRFYGVIMSVAVQTVLLLIVYGTHQRHLSIRWTFRDVKLFADGLGFSMTHALFWVRNGLDKILLFSLATTPQYARYGMFFFGFSAVQTVWTSCMRMAQKQIFDAVQHAYTKVLFLFAGSLLLLSLVLCPLYFVNVDYGFVICVGAALHLNNQAFLNLLNYHFPVFTYTSVNAVVAGLYLLALHVLPLNVVTLSYLFSTSNMLLGILYLCIAAFRRPTHV